LDVVASFRLLDLLEFFLLVDGLIFVVLVGAEHWISGVYLVVSIRVC
jgi:hypothetical protein